MLWNVIENNCCTSAETCRELEPALAANQGEGRVAGGGGLGGWGEWRMIWRRGGEEGGWVGAGEKQGLLVRRKENNLRFSRRINFHLTCPDGKISLWMRKAG